ncbi:type I-F CRISPR-associated protein Csy2 [Agarilytica rhodophyticola]|uniref:type I-F CRISPR-associated protein Csy2 n=1 Tax=Agarilytica rhodophyticola TaxID=1737490 RepID=UPI000B344FAF|nr:type I-F CRISPR-associated protein Csy2 [Agarilytica rhodophyticola]
MNQIILINRVRVQNANAVAGFTWGFPAITHFLGFSHNLSRKLPKSNYCQLNMSGCAVIAHEYQVHTYGTYHDRFIQSKNPAYLSKDVTKVGSGGAPSIIEEGKMNMVVSLLIGLDGGLGKTQEYFLDWVRSRCLTQRLAGGSILSIGDVAVFDLNDQQDFYRLKRKLLPGFALMDRSYYLSEHVKETKENNPRAENIDAWLDFSVLERRARPVSNLITSHLKDLAKNNESLLPLFDAWQAHLSQPYDGQIPVLLNDYFSSLVPDKNNKKLFAQWQEYINPSAKTNADWEFLPKPKPGYLVPIMIGYKAISPLYKNEEIANTRDSKTEVCFVESVHSVGEWQGVNRFRNSEDITGSLWHYSYTSGWYLCTQEQHSSDTELETEVENLFEPLDELQ